MKLLIWLTLYLVCNRSIKTHFHIIEENFGFFLLIITSFFYNLLLLLVVCIEVSVLQIPSLPFSSTPGIVCSSVSAQNFLYLCKNTRKINSVHDAFQRKSISLITEYAQQNLLSVNFLYLYQGFGAAGVTRMLSFKKSYKIIKC